MAFAGAGSTATLFFPDAPMPHHSTRASAVLHRFDFFKPVGWHDMAPITDGKYSVECYLDALDACYKTLRKKLNNRDVLAITDYNVFHTGGGYHIVRKAFERLVRNERPDSKGPERDHLVETKLNVSCSLLKIIGPCHTVSSFLNTSSVIMNTMEKGLGKVICVFTYGSGCAASMYQMRIDDVPYFDPIEIWKLKFYRNALKCNPEECIIHNFYVQTWMKFDYRPIGRRTFKIPVSKYEEDVYYLMEIDNFGRRFYHRGGLKTGPMDKKYMLLVDHEEDRGFRPKYGPIPEAPEERQKSIEEVWRDIEYEMTYDHEAEEGNFAEVGEFDDRYNSGQKVTIIKPYPERKRHGTTIDPDGMEHSYQIVGTWARRWPQEMVRTHDGSWTFEIVLSENRWEEFYLIQDWDMSKRIYPFQERSFKNVPTVGPHDGGHSKFWFLDCRDRMDVPEEQVGMPGDKYLVTFRWHRLKELSWDRLDGETGEPTPGQYYVSGSWADWDYVELTPNESKPGWYSTEVQMTSLGIEFKIVRNEDPTQRIYPLVLGPSDLPVTQHTPVQGPDKLGNTSWKVQDRTLGSLYRLSFFRDPEDCEPTAMKVVWDKVGERAVVEPEPNYYIIAAYNAWGANDMTKMARVEQTNAWTAEVPIQLLAFDPSFPDQKRPLMPFKLMMHKMPDRIIHPDKEDCTQLMRYTTIMDDESSGKFNWLIGKAPSDKAKNGDTFIVRLELQEDGSYKITWAKKQL
uniref:Hydroxymethylglutaryl-coenzyme A synthase C-terminal domain-containing protein n=1 Tax=Alexandrium catenella TaxID=2925 RepID=A0A7S1LWC9_ALECA